MTDAGEDRPGGWRGALGRLRAGGGEDEGQPLGGLTASLSSLLILVALAVLALALRVHQLGEVPGPLQAPDEYSFTSAGMSLLQGHAPSGATGIAAAYAGGQDVRFLGLSFHLVTPWLDHPPLFGLLPGAAELLSGVRDFSRLDTAVLRWPSAGLGVLTVLLGYQLARRLLPPAGAVLAAFLLAVEPGLVLLGRLALPEAALAPLLLLAVLLATPDVPESTHPGSAGAGPATDRPPAGVGLWLLLAACAISPLLRLSGLAVPLVAAALLLSRGIRREAALAAAAGAAGLLLWVVYGLAGGGGALLSVWAAEAGAGGGAQASLGFITGPIGAGKAFVDAWYLLGWAALAYLAGNAKRRHRYRALLWPVAAYSALVTPFLSGADIAAAGWYRLPILPLLLIGATAALYAAVREGQLLMPLLGLMLAGVWSLGGLLPSGLRFDAVTLALLLAVAAVPLAVSELRTRGAFRDAALGIWGLLAVLVLAGDTLLAWNLSP